MDPASILQDEDKRQELQKNLHRHFKAHQANDLFGQKPALSESSLDRQQTGAGQNRTLELICGALAVKRDAAA
jgi:hypothetical protein